MLLHAVTRSRFFCFDSNYILHLHNIIQYMSGQCIFIETQRGALLLLFITQRCIYNIILLALPQTLHYVCLIIMWRLHSPAHFKRADGEYKHLCREESL